MKSKHIVAFGLVASSFVSCKTSSSLSESSVMSANSNTPKDCSVKAFRDVVSAAKKQFEKDNSELRASIGLTNSADPTWVTRTAGVKVVIAGLKASECSITLGFNSIDDAEKFAKERVKSQKNDPNAANTYLFKGNKIRLVGKVVGAVTKQND